MATHSLSNAEKDEYGRLPALVPRTEARRGQAVQSRVDDAYWSLAMTLAWIAYRTETAVMNIRSGRWGPKGAVRSLVSALRSGKLAAHGMVEGERIPHPIETAIWSSFEIIIEPMWFCGHTSLMPIVIAQRMGAPRTRLLSATVPAAKVRKLWPAAKRTGAAETQSRKYLTAEMNKSLDHAPKPKRDFLADCQARFPGLSERGFERAWTEAKRLSGASGWGRAGRRAKPRCDV